MQHVLPVEHTANVMQARATVDRDAGRRFSVYVDATLEAGAAESRLSLLEVRPFAERTATRTDSSRNRLRLETAVTAGSMRWAV